ncbi:MAG: response regulator transcription factor [Caldilineaceae bacterium]
MTTQTSIRLLYVGRRQALADAIENALRIEHSEMAVGGNATFQFMRVSSQKQAIEEIRATPPHGLLVEIDPGRYNRIRFCNNLRGRLPQMLIVAVHKEHDISDGFEFDAFILRPFQPAQASEAIARLLGGSRKMYMGVGDLRLDLATRTVYGPLGEQHLPPKLCKLLQVLMERPGEVLSREELMQRVWDTEFLGDTRTLDVHIRWLRERIEENPSRPSRLITVRGAGYRLDGKREDGMMR